MINIIYYFRNDFVGGCLLTLNNIRKKNIRFFSNMVMVFKMRCIGVRYGRKILWGGVTQIERFPMSEISIGNECRFNSNSLFNQRGINRCIIQTGACGAKISIGDKCGFSGVSIVASNEVEIGNNVMVGANSLIGDRDGHSDRLHTAPSKITIKDNVFIGMHCMVMKGVTIGENSIIGAGSIVTKDIPANCIAAGVPCRVIKQIN